MGNQKIKIIGLVFVGLITATALVLALYNRQPSQTIGDTIKKLRVGSRELQVEIADTPAEQERGLSGRPSLADNGGMLFVYPDKAIRHFWMKDMRFPLDVLWIADSVVVGRQENIQPLTVAGEITRFQSTAPADMVLEVKAGWIREKGVKVGEAVVQN